MPIYEYRCNDCAAVSSRLVYSWSAQSDLQCPGCGGADMERLMSAFSFRPSWGDSLTWSPSSDGARAFDEDNAASIDQHMGRIKKEMGGQTTPDFERMRREIREG